MSETPEHRVKRLKLRAWRRGIKEMDLILGRFADARLAGLAPEALDQFDALLSESDHDLYQWISGQRSPPSGREAIVGLVAEHVNFSPALTKN